MLIINLLNLPSVNILTFFMNEEHQLHVYADDVKMLGENLQTLKEKTEILKNVRKDINLGVNSKKNFYRESVLVLDCSVHVNLQI